MTALSTASIADIDQVIQELQILRDDKATKEAGRLALLTRKEPDKCQAPPIEDAFEDPVRGAIIGYQLKIGGFGKRRSLDKCRVDCFSNPCCAAFQYSQKRRLCGFKKSNDVKPSTSTQWRRAFKLYTRTRLPSGA